MANTYRSWSKGRIPAAGDNNWNDEVDENFDINEALINNLAIRQNRVISGCLVSDNGGLNVAFASGVVEVAGSRYSVTGSTIGLTAGPSGGRLLNYIYSNNIGVVGSSTTLPTGNFVLLAVADTDDTDILRIGDVRVFAPDQIRFSAGVSVNEFTDDDTLGGGSPTDTAVPTEAAVQAYVLTNRRSPRNLFHNPEMFVSRRATSVTGITSSGYFTVDRMRIALSSAGTFGYAQDVSVVPPEHGACFKVDCEVAQASLPASSAHIIQQRHEGVSLQLLQKGSASARSLTVQFKVRSTKTGTYICELLDNDNNRHICASYTVNSADTWETKSVTFPGDTTGALDKDENYSFAINFWLAAGSNYTSGTLATSWASTVDANRAVGQVNTSDSTDNFFRITGVMMVPGDYAGPFEYLSLPEYERTCMRYYYGSTVSAAAANAFTASLVANCFINFPEIMRTAPTTVTITGVSLQASLGTYSSVNNAYEKRNGFSPAFNVTGATAGFAGFASFTWSVDAEL